MSFGQAVSTCLSKYVDFTGRARRSEFWWFVLFQVLVGIAASILDWLFLDQYRFNNDSNGPLQTIANLALFLPSIAVTVRRLHDIDRSGWWQLIGLVPIVGWILMLIWLIRDGQPHQNRFGYAPKGELTGSAGYQNHQNPGGYDGPQDYLPPRH